MIGVVDPALTITPGFAVGRNSSVLWDRPDSAAVDFIITVRLMAATVAWVGYSKMFTFDNFDHVAVMLVRWFGFLWPEFSSLHWLSFLVLRLSCRGCNV